MFPLPVFLFSFALLGFPSFFFYFFFVHFFLTINIKRPVFGLNFFLFFFSFIIMFCIHGFYRDGGERHFDS